MRSDRPLRRTTIAAQLHLWLAIASALLMVLAGLEAAWRAWRRSPPGSVAGRIENVLLLVLLVTTAGGLGLFVGGARPRELLHFVYAIIALAAVPVADSLARRVGPRQRGFATIAGSLVGFVVILRLFGTG